MAPREGESAADALTRIIERNRLLFDMRQDVLHDLTLASAEGRIPLRLLPANGLGLEITDLLRGSLILLLLIFGNAGKNEAFKPQNEFKLDNWIPIHLGPADLSINKAVLYLAIASALTIFAMIFIIKRFYNPKWGGDWRKFFSVEDVNGAPAHGGCSPDGRPAAEAASGSSGSIRLPGVPRLSSATE